MSDMDSAVNDFIAKLEKRKIEGSHATARLTTELLRMLISQQKLPSTNQAAALIQAVRGVGERLIAANCAELAVGNIVRRVLHVIREEDLYLETRDIEGLSLSDDENVADRPYDHVPSAFASRNILRPPSLYAILDNKQNSASVCLGPAGRDFEEKGKSEKNSTTRKLKQRVIEAINILIEEIDACYDQIAEQAVEHIHQNEVILTFGRSKTVLRFLSAAKEKKRSFRAFIAEGSPRYQGHVLAKELVKRGVQTTVVTDSAVFAIISRVNMVIVGVHAVMANGGAIAPIGMRMVALAAQKQAVPFVVVAGMHKLCPLYPNNPEILLNEMRSPFELLDYKEFSDCLEFESSSGDRLLHVSNPCFDYVPPELINLFITDIGGHTPSYMYRLISDYYSTDDIVLQHKAH